MSSVLFNRGILTQTGGRKKADDAERGMETLRKTVNDAALTTAEHTTLLRTLQAQITSLEDQILVLSEKLTSPLSPSEDLPEDIPESKGLPEVKSSKTKTKN
jgi:hypothetical protein